MKRKFFLPLAVVLILALVVFFSSGLIFRFHPELKTDPQFECLDVGTLKKALENREAATDRLKKGAESLMVVQNPNHARNLKQPHAFLYLHGFSATRQELSPVMEDLSAKLQWSLYIPRLRAHGLLDGEDFKTVKAQDWIDDSEEALQVAHCLGEQVTLVAMSSGVPLALHLATQHPKEIANMILLSPNFHPKDPRAKIVSGPFGPLIARLLIGAYREFKTDNDEHAYYWTARYRSEGIAALMDVVNYAATLNLKQIQIPVLMLYTQKDKVVDIDLALQKFAEFGSLKKKALEVQTATRHEIAGRILAPQAVDEVETAIVDFLQAN